MANHERRDFTDESTESSLESLGTPGDTSQVPSPVHAESPTHAGDPDEERGAMGEELGEAPSGWGQPMRSSVAGPYISLAIGTAIALFLCLAIVLVAREQAFFKLSDSHSKPSLNDETQNTGATRGAEDVDQAGQNWWSNSAPKRPRRRKGAVTATLTITMEPSDTTSALSESLETRFESANTTTLMSPRMSSNPPTTSSRSP